MLARDWIAARREYQLVLARRPGDAAFWLQLGHASRELGLTDEAEQAYARAIDLAPDDVDMQFHHARSLIDLDRKVDAMVRLADILRRAPDHREAYAAIVHHGGREHLPDGFQRSRLAEDPGVVRNLSATVDALAAWANSGTFPLNNYDGFRAAFPLRPPPAPISDGAFLIVVDGRATSPYFLRATLLSLIDQTRRDWRAKVVTTPTLADHPVASLGAADARIEVTTSAEIPDGAMPVVHLSAGTILDPHALDWFAFTIDRTGCVAAWCDEDRAARPWRSRPVYSDPLLWGVFDADLIAQTRSPPSVIVMRDADMGAMLSVQDPAEARRMALLSAIGRGSIAHVPRILATVLQIPPRAEIAPAVGEPIRLWGSDPDGAPPPPGPVAGLPDRSIVERGSRPAITAGRAADGNATIDVVIPTRDAPELLAKAVATLLDCAARPDRIRLTIVDNRSRLPETAACFDRLRERPGTTIVSLDEPFNWSRANNVAASRSTASCLVFANNDIEMLAHGWDDLLLGYLASQTIGAVGARLLYPDGSIQHAGIVFGTGEGSPRHEGVHCRHGDNGPLERYDLTHRTAAVTGAFLGVSRATFERIGGFDEYALAVGYNDIDFCLKLRAEGLDILYAPAIELIHHESKTRGLNIGREKVAWDQGELHSLYQRWGDAMIDDPAYNPQWSQDRLFDGYREPPLSDILRHMDQCICGWRVDVVSPAA